MDYSYKPANKSSRKKRKTRCLIALFVFLGIACLVFFFVGIALIAEARRKGDDSKAEPQGASCDYSEEAKRVKLDDFLERAQNKYYELNPNKIASKPGVTPAEVKNKYHSYDPTPERIKLIADESAKIVKDIEKMPVDMNKLTLREKRAVAQLLHWAKHSFPFMVPYSYDYYVGDWMMGADIFCWNPICMVPTEVQPAFKHFKPSTVSEMETLKAKFKELNHTFVQFVENMKLGVAAGMVRTTEECKAGLDGLKNKYRDVAVNGPTGIYEASFIKPFLAKDFISNMKDDEWRGKFGKSASESLREFALEYVGKPIDYMLRFIKEEQVPHCAPDSVATGLGSLPLAYVFVNGSQTNTKTTQELPTGEKLNGKDSYKRLLAHFTTTSQTPDEIYNLGKDMRDKLYSEVLKLATEVTKVDDENEAKRRFKELINDPKMFYNDKEIPANESDANAHKVCSTVKDAEKYCPHRTAAMENWFEHTKQIMATLDYETAGLFHVTGPYKSTPSCPIKLDYDLNPSSAVPFYMPSDASCSKVASYKMPFFLAKPGPRYESVTLAAHEARPGHHTQVQGYTEHFTDSCEGPIRWIAVNTLYLAFAEGWALYAENPLIPENTSAYQVDPISKYGMLKWQVWRALRLMMDTGLHFKGNSRAWALTMFEEYAWDTSDVAVKEVTRYQSIPGQAVTYMLGQLAIMRLKDQANSTLKEKFNTKDFHYQVLRQGPSPLSYLEESVKKYISCVQDKEEKGCDDVLNPPAPKPQGSQKESFFRDMGFSPWVV